jgi:uncharacterized protein (TIGR00251 family)
MIELLRVRVQPGATRDEVLGWREDALRVRVAAPPHDGRANRAVTRLLAAALGVAPSTVVLVRGAAARDKFFRVRSLDAGAVRARLGAPGAPVGPTASTPRRRR